MKMTTAKKPQKKFIGGMMKKLAPKIAEMVKTTKAAAEKAAAKPAAAEGPTVKSKARGFLGKLAKNVSKFRGRGFKTGGPVMADKAGRAMTKKTADARGRAMKGK